MERIKITSYMFHDIVESGDLSDSGLPENWDMRGADAYKLDINQFEYCLSVLCKKLDWSPLLLEEGIELERNEEFFILTFDDGGSSAYTTTCNILLKYKLFGHFFVVTDFIGKPSFLNENQIIHLRKSGHVIGSHSCSHPYRMSSCSMKELEYEWGKSVNILSDIIGEQIITASVPGGYYSPAVAQAASKSGIKFLFTSEPISKIHKVENCWVINRLTIKRKMKDKHLMKLFTGATIPRLQQWVSWNIKKLAKHLLGEYYLAIRNSAFDISK